MWRNQVTERNTRSAIDIKSKGYRRFLIHELATYPARMWRYGSIESVRPVSR